MDGCLLQTQWPGPSVGEFVMCSLTLKSHVFTESVSFPAKNRSCKANEFSYDEVEYIKSMTSEFLV